jgi:hypothetical protein
MIGAAHTSQIICKQMSQYKGLYKACAMAYKRMPMHHALDVRTCYINHIYCDITTDLWSIYVGLVKATQL